MSKQMKNKTLAPKKFRRLTVTTLLVVTVVMAIAVVTVASRQRARSTEAAQPERSAQVANKSNFVKVQVAGQEVEVDSQTGQIRELTPEEARKLAAGLKELANQSTEGLEQVQHADGSVSMDLKGRFQNVTVARVNDDGSVTTSCIDNPQAGAEFFRIDPKLVESQPVTQGSEKP